MLLGGVALVAGAAAYLRVSALLAGVACGATLALVGGRAVERVARALGRFERPTYLVLVFLVGAHVQARDVMAWALLPAYVGLRFLGKVLGGSLAQRIAGSTLDLPPRLGYALIAQGGLALCLVAEYLHAGAGLAVPARLRRGGGGGASSTSCSRSRAFRHVLEPAPVPARGEHTMKGALLRLLLLVGVLAAISQAQVWRADRARRWRSRRERCCCAGSSRARWPRAWDCPGSPATC